MHYMDVDLLYYMYNLTVKLVSYQRQYVREQEPLCSLTVILLMAYEEAWILML